MQRRLNVLVVDDELIVATAVGELLTEGGHVASIAHDAAEALFAAARIGRLDAAILDLQLPDGSGAGLITELRRRWPGLPIVISTGYALDAGERAALDPAAGRTVVLKKPWTESQLLAALSSAAGAPAG